tara:strand:+ start:52 stop:264 length:213 start_codon:yes stop_codon:yes gene_type:complete
MITIEKAQQLRTQGYNIVTNRNFTKVLRYSKDDLKMENRNERLYRAMIKVTYTAEQQKAAWNLHCKINKI